MKLLLLSPMLILLLISQNTYANTPTEALEITVNKLITVAGNEKIDEKTKKSDLTEIIISDIDFEAVSRRVVSRHWKKASKDQKKQFKQHFLVVMVNTYFSLLKDYSNQKVLFLKEQLKKNKYAIVDTQIISGNKKIPVRYRLIKSKDSWKVYDLIPEGISMISTYKKNYASIIKKKGMDGLISEMKRIEDKKATEK